MSSLFRDLIVSANALKPNIPMKEVAEIMSMEEAYELFGETEIEKQEEQPEQACVAA